MAASSSAVSAPRRFLPRGAGRVTVGGRSGGGMVALLGLLNDAPADVDIGDGVGGGSDGGVLVRVVMAVNEDDDNDDDDDDDS